MNHFLKTVKKQCLALCIMGTASLSCSADWAVDPSGSSVHFVSIKNNIIGEVHQFNTVSGDYLNGQLSVEISLASVETGIAIRNERMQEHLFETQRFPKASIRANIDKKIAKALKTGQKRVLDVPFTLDLHGHTVELTAKVEVVKLRKGVLSVNTISPIMLSATDFGLGAGIATLQKLAGLTSIATSVPVNATLHLIKKK